jgi:hypothetical protein
METSITTNSNSVIVSSKDFNEEFTLVDQNLEAPPVLIDYEKLSGIYRRHVTDMDKVTPYDVGACPNYPGSSNLLFIPKDTCNTIKSLAHSVRKGDHEGTLDASARLLGIPANFVSATGFLAGYGVAFGILPKAAIPLLPVAYWFGVALCVIEGSVDIWSLNRQMKFASNFDFDFLSKLRYMAADFDPVKSPKAVEDMAEYVKNDPPALVALYKDGYKDVKDFFLKLNDELRENPYDSKEILKKHEKPILEIARLAALKNLKILDEKYLQLNQSEVNEVEAQIIQENPHISSGKAKVLIEKELCEKLQTKKTSLARRVRPWMVAEASETVPPLIKGITNNEPEAIKESLRLTDAINIQCANKKIVHWLGIAALVFAAVSIVTMCIACPAFSTYLFVGIATTFAIARICVFEGFLDSRRWTFETRKIFPNCIANRIWGPDNTTKVQEDFRQREVNALTHNYVCIQPDWELNRSIFQTAKEKTTPPSPHPAQKSEGSQKSRHDERRLPPSRSAHKPSFHEVMQPTAAPWMVNHLFV